MGTTKTTLGKRQIELKRNVLFMPSNKVSTSSEEFERDAKFYPAGTIFIDYGKGDWSETDDDSMDTPLHGWCYIEGYDKQGSPLINYCNFLAYILDYWPQRKDLFWESEP